ncbi:HD domain-containing protein [Francisella philomiragia]|nr:HD domain-containing protein [Francisella philomiragia]
MSDYKSMDESTSDDIKNVVDGLNKYCDADYLVDMYSRLLLKLQDSKEGFPINRFEHSLQSATLAYKDGRELDYVISALLHDVGEIFDPFNHDHIIAELLRNYISDKCYFILKYHTIFQGYNYWDKIGLNKNLREEFKDSPYYNDAVEFIAKYDDKAFSKTYENMTLDEFKPLMKKFFELKHINPSIFNVSK